MSLVADALGALRRVVLLDHRVEQLERDVRGLGHDVRGHERRVQQIETVLFGPVNPDRLRLPRE